MTKISLDELIAMLPQDAAESAARINAWELRVLHDRCGPEISIIHRASHDVDVSEELRINFQNEKQRVRIWVKRFGESITNADFSLAFEIASFVKSRTNYPIRFSGLGVQGYQRIYAAREAIRLENQKIFQRYAKK